MKIYETDISYVSNGKIVFETINTYAKVTKEYFKEGVSLDEQREIEVEEIPALKAEQVTKV
jgi:hypothetical protein